MVAAGSLALVAVGLVLMGCKRVVGRWPRDLLASNSGGACRWGEWLLGE